MKKISHIKNMKKNYNKTLFESSYNAIMNALSEQVKKIIAEKMASIEECGDVDVDECGENLVDECGDIFDECYESLKKKNKSQALNEMAVKRTINPKALANVRDAASRRNFDETWATNVEPLSKFDDVELLNRYVAALLVFHKECPQSEEDIDKIGVFKNYAHKMIDEGTMTIDDVINLYNQQDKLSARPRRGTARANKSYASAATKENPSADFNFDSEDTAPVAPEATEPEAVEPKTPDYPAYDEVETEPETPANDELDVDNFETFDEEGEEETSGEIVEIDNIKAVTKEQFDDPKMIDSFVNFNDDVILKRVVDGKPQIGFEITITDEDKEESKTHEIYGDTFGEVLRNLNVITTASLSNIATNFFSIKTNQTITIFRKRYATITSDEDEIDKLDEDIDDFKVKCFNSAKTIDEIIAEIDKIDY